MDRKDNLLGQSEVFAQLLEQLSKVAQLVRPVLLIGERGTGKELLAERLHYLSPRWEQNFIKLNCATISEELLVSELFGHEAGSFTGATQKHIGRFERADGGTIFLDEIANTSRRLQEKILRVVEYGEFERVGGDKTIKTDVRIIAATNVDLPSEAQAGRFRADLLDRLAFDVLTIPPLRYRGQDILLLAQYFAVKMARELGRESFLGFASEVEKELLEYPWPGNVRELKNVVERAVYRSSGIVERLQFDPFASPFRLAQNASDNNQLINGDNIAFKKATEEFEKKLLKQALIRNRFNHKLAAQALELSYNQLRGLLRKYKAELTY